MSNQALNRAIQITKAPLLPSSDEGFTPQLAREIIQAYHDALRALVGEVLVDKAVLKESDDGR
jgi:hypothetical protein